jgi:hypothetical protein
MNKQEGRVHAILVEKLVPAGLRVEHGVRVDRAASILELSTEEMRFATRAHFDFVAFEQEPPGKALFALEFDGPFHGMPKSQESDGKKNAICKRANLPLLRLCSRDIEQHDGYNILAHILDRYIAWPKESLALSQEISAYLDTRSEEERERLLADPDSFAYDIGGIFDRRHRYPPLRAIRARLFLRRAMAFEPAELEAESAEYLYLCNVSLQSLGCIADPNVSCSLSALVRRKPDGQIIYSAESKAEVRAWMPTGSPVAMEPIGILEDGEEKKERYWRRRTESIWHITFPGLDCWSLAQDLAEYQALRDLERWARKHLPAQERTRTQ